MDINWKKITLLESQKIDQRLKTCLSHTGSLTRYLQEHCKGVFELELQSESWHEPLQYEKQLLGLPSQEHAFIRESWLKVNNQKIVYARTVIPEKTAQGKNKLLTQLGSTPLGEILFSDTSTRRTSFNFAEITEQCDLFNIVKDDDNKNETIWGRQSLFYIQNEPLLVSEVFLPGIIKCIQN